jgi:hypothetical protein
MLQPPTGGLSRVHNSGAIGQFVRRRLPSIRFLFIGSHFCSTLL